jgi:hypothetical protein
MKRILLRLVFFIALTALPFITPAQIYNYLWDRTYGGDARDWNCQVTIDPSGNIFIAGDSQTDINGDKTVPLCNVQPDHSDIWILKTGLSGNIIWQKNYGGEGYETNPKLILLNNPAKEMIFTCFTTSDVACDKSEPNRDTIPLLSADYWVVKLDSNGVILWEKTIGGDNFDDYNHIAQLSNGNILIAGESNSPVGYDKSVPNYSISNDFWVVVVDASGNIISDHVFGGDGGEFLSAIIPDNSGGYLLAGSTNSDVSGDVSEPTQGNFDFWMIKVDALGNKVWDKRFGGSGPDRCNHASMTSDGGYLLTGFTVSPADGDVSQSPKGLQDYWVVKTDAGGNKLWDKRFGGTGGSFGTFGIDDGNGEYWITGYTNSALSADVSQNSYGSSDYWVLKTNNAGDKLFDKRFGGSGNDFATGISILNDSTYLAFGYSDSGSSPVKTATSKGLFDYWIVGFELKDSLTSLQENIQPISVTGLYPIPAKTEIHCNFNLLEDAVVEFSITDMQGKQVKYQSDKFVAGKNNQLLDLKGLSNGMYQISITSNRFRSALRFAVINEHN